MAIVTLTGIQLQNTEKPSFLDTNFIVCFGEWIQYKGLERGKHLFQFQLGSWAGSWNDTAPDKNQSVG